MREQGVESFTFQSARAKNTSLAKAFEPKNFAAFEIEAIKCESPRSVKNWSSITQFSEQQAVHVQCIQNNQLRKSTKIYRFTKEDFMVEGYFPCIAS